MPEGVGPKLSKPDERPGTSKKSFEHTCVRALSSALRSLDA
jgi:hypothetical protein